MEVTCPKCAKVFRHPLYISKANQALQSHIKRKNPCDANAYIIARPVTFDVPDMNRLDLTGVLEEMRDNIHLRDKFRLSTIFRILLKRNNFATVPNIGTGRVLYKLHGSVICSGPGQFIKDFWAHVLVLQVGPMLSRDWPEFYAFNAKVEAATGISLLALEVTIAHLNRWFRSDQYRVLNSVIQGFFRTELSRSERIQIGINMGPQTPDVMVVTEAL